LDEKIAENQAWSKTVSKLELDLEASERKVHISEHSREQLQASLKSLSEKV